MKHYVDYQLKGHAMVFDGPIDLVTRARKALGENAELLFANGKKIRWPERQGSSWDDMERFVKSPWPKAVKVVSMVADHIRKQDLPLPPDRRRKQRWSEDNGEVDVDRVLEGEPAYMRETWRARVQGPAHIALLNNLDLGSGDRCNASGVFFRSSCAIALADVLEDLGYTVEIWCWCLGENVYSEPYSNQFTAVRPKEAGRPVDYHAICDTMSAWFTTHAIFQSFHCNPKAPVVSAGRTVHEKYGVNGLEGSAIGQWYKYLDLDNSVKVMTVPMIRSWNVQSGMAQAAEVAVQILEHLRDS